jgi:hypothetical protein
MSPDPILTIALASFPTMLTVLIGILINNSRLSDLASRISKVDSGLNARINDLSHHMDTRFDDMRAMWQNVRRIADRWARFWP